MSNKDKLKALQGIASGVFKGKMGTATGVNYWLDTGFLPLNEAISSNYDDGVPSQRIIEIFGAESCGKTAIATSVMMSAQKQGGLALFMDHERSFMPHLAEKAGLAIDDGTFIHATPKTFEESLDMVVEFGDKVRENKIIPDEAPIVVVLDSLAAMVPKSKLAKSNAEQGMHDTTALARACSSAFPALQQFATDYNMCIVVLNQTRENIGVMFGDNTTTPGGNAKNFYYSVRIGLTRKMVKDKDKNVIGQDITAKVIKNKVAAPFKQCSWRFSFRDDGTGFLDSLHSSIEYLIERGDLETSGAYVIYNGKKIYKTQLTDKIREAGQEDVIYNMIRKPKSSAA